MANEQVVVGIGGDIGSLNTSLQQAEKKLANFKNKGGKSVDAFSKKLRSGLTTGAKGAGVAIAGLTTALAGMYAVGAQNLDQQAKLSRAIEGSVAATQSLELASNRSGAQFNNVTKAIQKLNIGLSEASDPASKSAKALDRLGLSASDLQKMDVDQRLQVFSQKFEELGYSTSDSLAELKNFGVEGRELIKIMDNSGSAIAAAKQELKDYGLLISDVDAAKVEQANDSFDKFGTILDGVSKVLATEAAPLIEAFSNMLTDSAKNGEGMGEKVKSGFEKIMNAGFFVMDAIDGVGRVFKVVGKGIGAGIALLVEHFNKMVISFQLIAEAAGIGGLKMKGMFIEVGKSVQDFAISKVNDLIKTLNQVPGINIDIIEPDSSGLGSSLDNIEKQLTDKQARFDSLTNEFSNSAKRQAEIAASFMDDAQATLTEPMAGNTARKYYEEAKKASEETAQAFVANNQLQADAANTTEEQKTTKAQLEAQKRLDNLTNSWATEREKLAEKLLLDEETLALSREQGLLNEEEHAVLLAEARKRHADTITKIDADAEKERADLKKKYSSMALSGASSMLGDLSVLMDTENKKQFKIGKAAAKGKAVIDTYAAAQGAYSSLASIPIVGPALGIAAAGAATIAGMARVKAINSQKFGGSNASATAGGGGGSLPTAYPGAQNSPAPSIPSGVLAVEGFGASDFVSSERAMELMKKTNEFSRNGGTVDFI